MGEAENHLMTIFSAALDCGTEEERAAYVEVACGGDEELRARVEALLRAHEHGAGFLDLGAVTGEQAATEPDTGGPPAGGPGETPDRVHSPEAHGSIVGPYRLLQVIGEGGMGTVYLAEQTVPVRRTVALKVIKPGMDSRQVLARFDAERQALALMDHPNIARVLDAGTTAQGRPYFVMELVKGVPITQFCDERRLTLRERLELFIPVCQAVQHAHQKGIIHRDIKPSNVLVALYDGKPVPKVIDFGVAKATGEKLTEATLHTGFGTVVGTPEYMSPEQAEMNQPDIDTRSDIYSLGVLLYELLTGSTPLQRRRLGEAALLEILRLIREEEPPKPSTRLDTTDELPSIAANRNIEPRRLRGLVCGDLDWVVMKCLEKDRGRRYETARDLSRDLDRYLHDEPVEAGPPSLVYRIRKFARRNRGVLAVALTVVVSLVLLGGGAGWVWRDRASRHAALATNLEHAVSRAEQLQREGKRREALAALERARLLAREAVPGPSVAGRITALQQIIDAEERDAIFVARFEASVTDAGAEVELEKNRFQEGDVAYSLLRQAFQEYGIPWVVTPPDAAAACIRSRPSPIQSVLIAALDESRDLESRLRTDPGSRRWFDEVLSRVDDNPWRSQVRRAWFRPAALEALARDVDVRQHPPSFLVRVFATLPRPSPVRWELARRVQFAYPGDFWANAQLGLDLNEVERYAEAIRYHTAALSLRPDNPGVLLNRAIALDGAGESEAALTDLRHATSVAPRYAFAHMRLGKVLKAQGRPAEAIAAYRKALEIDPKSSGAYLGLGGAFSLEKRLPEAIAAYRRAIELNPREAEAYCNLGQVLRDQGKPDEAIESYRKAIEIDPKHAHAHHRLAIALKAQGRLDDAIDAYRKAIDLDPQVAIVHNNLGLALQAQGKRDEAIAAFRRATELDRESAQSLLNLGTVLGKQGKLNEAIVAFLRAIEVDPKCAMAYNNLGSALSQQKRPLEAIEAYRRAIEIDPKHPLAHANLARRLHAQGELDQAIIAFRKAIEVDPKDASIVREFASVLEKKGDLNEVVAAYRRTIERDPNVAEDHFRLGFALHAQGNPGEAIRSYRRALELGPNHSRSHLNLGLLLATCPEPKSRDLPRAVEHVTRAAALEPRSPEVLQITGWVRYVAGAWRESVQALEESCRLQEGGKGDSGQWIVLALAHARLALQPDVSPDDRARHETEARRRYEQADRQINEWWPVRPGHPWGKLIWDFRDEARRLIVTEKPGS